MVTGLRQAMIGHQETSMALAMGIISTLVIVLTVLNVVLLRKGVGLRD
jgi:ABC-2 type transport system permease protein